MNWEFFLDIKQNKILLSFSSVGISAKKAEGRKEGGGKGEKEGDRKGGREGWEGRKGGDEGREGVGRGGGGERKKILKFSLLE